MENEDRMFDTHERIPVSVDNAGDNGDNIENAQNSNATCVDANEEAVACETHGEAYVQTRILDNERSPTVDEALLTHTIELQLIFDKSHMSMALQSEILELLFGSFGKRVENDEGCLDVEKLSLGELLTLKGKDWNGEPGWYVNTDIMETINEYVSNTRDANVAAMEIMCGTRQLST